MQLDSFRKGTGPLFQQSIIPKFRVKVMVRVSRSRVSIRLLLGLRLGLVGRLA